MTAVEAQQARQRGSESQQKRRKQASKRQCVIILLRKQAYVTSTARKPRIFSTGRIWIGLSRLNEVTSANWAAQHVMMGVKPNSESQYLHCTFQLSNLSQMKHIDGFQRGAGRRLLYISRTSKKALGQDRTLKPMKETLYFSHLALNLALQSFLTEVFSIKAPGPKVFVGRPACFRQFELE